ncbi:putative PIG3 family NAD(P)H quinone oxidoreductase [Devosia subaequoris]|uniref:Putative PIG3 family NAD(P)H quinone oxidoreductase n=1 Tax=Devosia subaequoris TaxID=395930 RepID=A0A7W6IN96_9HYPH|nr:NAD(P)H-quinone oxidoreductase [Devosia subaequoris]MBB4052714.1 putative PIG3 family NAD(P)H quinone oxidoreductase [Devosia subaequoris]MCP1209868.1 NAD(P)H-quinone oxidoreductase [Devosia subaequoris]
MTLPEHMTAVCIAEPGGPEVLTPCTSPVPQLGPTEVLIQVAAAGINGPDLAQRRGLYAPPPGASRLPGLEVAGEIVAMGGEVTDLALGDRVMALTNGGGYAEYVAVPFGQVLPVPHGWRLAEAAALPETWFTVTQTLVMRAGLRPGMHVLVHGGAGGIGGAAIQICSIVGAHAIAVVSDGDKASYCNRLGAIATIDRARENIVDRVMALTDGRGADRVVDLIGGALTAVNIAASARGGHIVQVSTLEGATANVPLRTIMAKDLTLSGSTLRPQTAATKAAIAAHIRDNFLSSLSAANWIKPAISTFPLAEAARAHAEMESRRHRGKLILLTAFGAANPAS